jgi:hypothetical protein
MASMTETNRRAGDRRYLIGFSLAGSLITILFFAFINFSTGTQFPWFLFPAYAVLWWPLMTIFAGRHSKKVLSLIGSFLMIALLVLINYLTSWDYPWFLFPSFAILWWPLAMFFGKGRSKTFSIIGSLVIIAASFVTNYVTSPSVIWFYYPAFAVIWWPLSVLLEGPRAGKVYSVVGAPILAAFLTLDNLLKSPFCPWALLTYFPILMWPVGVLFGKHLGKLYIALFGSFAGILYYTILNLTVFPGYPWAIFPAYALLWWPLSIFSFVKQKRPLLFSVAGTLLSAALFIAVNVISSPDTIWAVYPIFGILWWPLSIYYFVYRQRDAEHKGSLFGNK